MSARPRGVLVIVLPFLLGLGGCGYSFRGTLPANLKTVAVPVFANRTAQPNVESALTNAIVQAFAANGRLQVAAPERADTLLTGEVASYSILSIAFDPNANVRQYRLVVTLNLRFKDRRTDKVLLERNGLPEQADFSVGAGVASTIAIQEAALQTAAAEIAKSVVSLVIEPF